jgi:hypothetical protein
MVDCHASVLPSYYIPRFAFFSMSTMGLLPAAASNTIGEETCTKLKMIKIHALTFFAHFIIQ